MPTLDELMAGLGTVSEQERKAAMMQALMTAGMGLLAAPPGAPVMQNLGRAGLLGMGDYNNQLAGIQQGKKEKIKLRGEAMDALTKEQAFNQQQDLAAVLPGFKYNGASPAPGAAPAQGPAGVGGFDAFDYHMKRAEYLYSKNQYAAADAEREKAMKYAPQYEGTDTVMKDGKPVLLQKYKNRAPTTLEGYAPKPEINLENLGDRTVAIDKLSLTPGQEFKRGVGPDTAYSGNITMRGQNMTDARARESNAIAQGNKAQTLTTDIRKEFNALEPVKAFGQVMPALQSAREAAPQDTAAADLNIIYAAAKIFDPTSVVRESETTMVMNSGSPSQRFMGQFNYVAGGGRLTPKAREQLMQQIESRARGYEAPYKSARKTYDAIARKNGVAPEDVFIEPSVTAERAPNARSGAIGGAGWSIREVK